MQKPYTQWGFTLIELIVVVMLLSILAVGTVRFLNDAAAGFQAGTERSEVSANVRQSVQHIGHALREALPNTIRVSASGDCVEFIPIINATTYLSAPIGLSSNLVQVVPFDSPIATSTWRVAIAPTSAAYTTGTSGAISPVSTASAPDANNIVTLQLANSHTFASASPQQRLFAIAEPVSYCLNGNSLHRYENYGYSPNQPTLAALPNSLPGRSKLVAGIAYQLPVFELTSSDLTRNASVLIRVNYTQGDTELAITQAVQVRNQI